MKRDLESEIRKVLDDHRGRIKQILKMRERTEDYVDSEMRHGEKAPIISTGKGNTIRLGMASHWSGDPGGFKKLGFEGYSQFYSIPKEERNEYLHKILKDWEDLFDKVELKKNKRKARLYKGQDTELPKCQSAMNLEETFREKRQQIEEFFEIKDTKNKVEILKTRIQKAANSLLKKSDSIEEE